MVLQRPFGFWIKHKGRITKSKCFSSLPLSHGPWQRSDSWIDPKACHSGKSRFLFQYHVQCGRHLLCGATVDSGIGNFILFNDPVLGFLALGIGLGQASNALIGNEQGAGNRKQASHLAAQAASLGMIAVFIGLVAGWNLLDPLYHFMRAEGEFLIVALDYMEVLVLVVLALVMSYAFNGMLNSQE